MTLDQEIQDNPAAVAAQANGKLMEGDRVTTVVHVKTVEEKTAKNGNKYWLMTDGNDKKSSTWDTTVGTKAKSKEGQSAAVVYEADGNFTKLVSVEDATETSAPAPPGTTGTTDTMSKEDWLEKDKRISKTALYKSVFQNDALVSFAVTHAQKNARPVTPEIIGAARYLVSRAMADIFGETLDPNDEGIDF